MTYRYLGDLIFFLSKELKQAVEQALKEHPFNFTHVQVILMVKRLQKTGVVTQEIVTSKLFLDKSNVSRSLKFLESGEYVTIRPLASDVRRKEIWLTEKGEQEVEHLLVIMRTISSKMTKNISKKDTEIAVRTLAQLMENLEHLKEEHI
jgi:DNA-binding MarR family transcriptional regulator